MAVSKFEAVLRTGTTAMYTKTNVFDSLHRAKGSPFETGGSANLTVFIFTFNAGAIRKWGGLQRVMLKS